MAKKVQPVNILPAPSSSDEETDASTDDEQQPQHPSQPQKPQNQEPESEEESDDSDDETEDDNKPEPQPVVKKPSSPQPQESEQSDDDSDDNSDDDSDETQNSPSAFTIKPIVSKSPEQKTPTSKPPRVKSRAKRPAESEEKETEKPSKAVSKNQEPEKVKGGNSKRPAEIEIEKIDKASKGKKSKGDGQSVVKVEKGSTSKKVVSGDDEAEEKKSIIKWGEKDEDALLVGIIDFKAETGEDVNPKVDTFYEYVKDLLSIDLTRNQLYEKIRRLKKKFQTNVEKWQNGEEPVFSKPRENKLFELSQKIWGSQGAVAEGNDSKVRSSKKKDKKDGIVVVGNTSTPLKQEQVTNRELFVQEEVKNTVMEVKKVETKDFWSMYPLLCASLESEASGFLTLRAVDLKEYVKQIISGIGAEKARELEDGWKAVHVLDHQLYVKKARLNLMQAEAVAEILRG